MMICLTGVMVSAADTHSVVSHSLYTLTSFFQILTVYTVFVVMSKYVLEFKEQTHLLLRVPES